MKDEVAKPWVVVVDAGRLYDPLAHMLEDEGVPVFRTADRALRLFGLWAAAASRALHARRRHSPVSSTIS
jgi:hypothetical protein